MTTTPDKVILPDSFDVLSKCEQVTIKTSDGEEIILFHEGDLTADEIKEIETLTCSELKGLLYGTGRMQAFKLAEA